MWPFNKRAGAPVEQKAGLSAGATSFFFGMGGGKFMPASAYAKEGYSQNPIAFACVHKAAKAAASVGLQLQKSDNTIVDRHKVLDLLARPNTSMSGSDFVEAVIAWRLIAGEVFISRGKPGPKPAKDAPLALYVVSPASVKIIPGGFGLPDAYEYKIGQTTYTYPVDPISGACDLIHLKTFNPLDPTRGMPPMAPAASAIDTHNAMMRWNKALLDNSGRPSGAMVVKNADGSAGTLTDEQFARVKQGVDEQTGPDAAGRPMLLEGGLEWQAMGLDPKDMDFIQGVWQQATHIAAAFNIAPQMLGIPGSATFANFEQATLSFWEDTVLPLLEGLLDALNNWLLPLYPDGKGMFLAADKDTISALESRRQVLFDRAEKSTDLTVNERRVMKGFDEVPDGDVILVPSTVMPLDMVAADLSEPAPKPEDAPADA